MGNERPSFIVFMTDQQRADHLGCYGNPIVRTPNIDAIANRGTRFDNFYVTNPVCQPNRAALATGQLTSVNGCRQNGIPLGLVYRDSNRATFDQKIQETIGVKDMKSIENVLDGFTI